MEELLFSVQHHIALADFYQLCTLCNNDHPELDTSDFLDEHMMQVYQSLIVLMQWAVSLVRMDMACAL